MTQEPLSAARRFAITLSGWGMLFLAIPGELGPDGSLLLAVLGVGLWGSAVVRPLGEKPLRGLLAEALANSLGSASTLWWVGYVVAPGVAYIGIGMAVYFALGCGLGRLLARRFSLPLAVALAFWVGEAGRTILPPPLGLPWFQLGHFAHHQLWLSGSARLWGVEGLSLVVGLLGGGVTSLLRARSLGFRPRDLLWGAAALGLAAWVSAVTTAPETRTGPRVLIVQPGFTQAEKQHRSWRENHAEVVRQSLEALSENERQGGAPVDLVAWGETMLQVQLFDPDVAQALARGINAPPWWDPFTASDLGAWANLERFHVHEELLDHLTPGTSFLAGAVVWAARGEELRRHNAVVLYGPDGKRGPAVAKRFLVPGAESVHGLERFAWVRAISDHFMNYIPDFVPAEETGVMELELGPGSRLRLGRPTVRFGASVCFDNGFVTPYVEPLQQGPLDFHLVLSNEDWYRGSFEMDQMIALSRIAALASGRSIVRATNSGVSSLIGPDGRELARLWAQGRDRLVAGSLILEVPVPVDPAGSPPPYGALRAPIRFSLGLFSLLLALVARRPRKRVQGAG